MPATLTVVVATSGRSSLVNTLASIGRQLIPGDETIVVCNDAGDWGNAARNSAIARANGSHLVFIDDDDIFARGALQAMREFASSNPGRVGVFRMRYRDGTLLWRTPVFEHGNLGTPTFVVPNVRDRLPQWNSELYDADWHFVKACTDQLGDPIFVDRVVAHLRPRRNLPVRLIRKATRLWETRKRPRATQDSDH